MLETKKRLHPKVPKKHCNLPDDCCISEKMKLRLDSLGKNSKLIWSLSKEQIDYIEQNYSYTILPHIYKIKTSRKIRNVKNQPSILKQLSKGAHNGKSHLIIPLKKQDIDILDALEIAYTPFKYKISAYPISD